MKKIHGLLGIKSFRTKNIFKHVSSSIIFQIGSMIANFLIVPLSINYLEAEKFGVWLTITSFVSWFSFFDIGLGNGLRNKLTESITKNNIEKAKGYVSTAYFTLTLISTSIIVLFFFINQFIEWDRIFNTSSVSEWLWDWTAPSSNTGDVTFYVSSNHANGNGTTSSDEIFLSQHTFTEDNGASVSEQAFSAQTASFIAETNELFIVMNHSDLGLLNVGLYDINGKQVLNKKKLMLSSGENVLRFKVNTSIDNGTYVLALKQGGEQITEMVKILR